MGMKIFMHARVVRCLLLFNRILPGSRNVYFSFFVVVILISVQVIKGKRELQ